MAKYNIIVRASWTEYTDPASGHEPTIMHKKSRRLEITFEANCMKSARAKAKKLVLGFTKRLPQKEGRISAFAGISKVKIAEPLFSQIISL